jgi:hypothetical protein
MVLYFFHKPAASSAYDTIAAQKKIQHFSKRVGQTLDSDIPELK